MARLIRIVNPNELKPVHIVMLVLVALSLAGHCLLSSAGKPRGLHDGANEWAPDSLLLAVVEILNLEYAQPTPHGMAIKSLVAGTATGVGIIVAAFGLYLRSRGRDAVTEDDAVIEVDDQTPNPEGHASGDDADRGKKHIDPILASQLLMLAYVAWGFASMLWSNAPSFTFGGAVILAVNVLWAFALAYCFNRRAASIASYLLVGVLVLTAIIAIAYFYQRNPNLRASYPIGNPLFLAACLIPGVLIALTMVIRGLTHTKPNRVVPAALFFLAVAVMAYAFYLTDSRGPFIALVLGVMAVAAFAGGRDIKLAAGVAGIIGIAAVGLYFLNQRDAASATGRSGSMRVRIHTWNYAMDLLAERPLTGHGLGGYALLADGYSAGDVLSDPEALQNRFSHAHSEWLEVGSDLGVVGLVLVMGGLLLAVYGGARSIPTIADPTQRWVLIGVCSALVALVIEECFDVGLQLIGVPFIFYTVLGLTWALSRPVSDAIPRFFAKHHLVACLSVAVIALAGLGVVILERADFHAARHSYQANVALEANEWSKASSHAFHAYSNRLSPQRKLTALMQRIATETYVAEQLQMQYLRRLRISESPARRDALLMSRLAEDRKLSEKALDRALTDIASLRSVTRSEMGIGMLEYNVRKVRAVYARVDDRMEDAAAEGALAAQALALQVERQPFEPELAARLVMASGGQMEIPVALEILARPLRMGTVVGIYLEAVGVLNARPDFETVGREAIERELEAYAPEDLPARLDRWAPEMLRVGAISAYALNQYDRAVEYQQVAAKMYDDAERIPLMARAGCYAELADAIFFAHPDDPALAIKAAESALKLTPKSQPGRALTGMLRERILAYHLSADHESFVRDLLQKQMPSLEAAQIDQELASRYVKMAYSILNTAYQRVPYKLNGWSQRAVALDPQSAPVWFLAADISLRAGDADQTVERINRAIEFGGEPQDVYAIVLRAQQAMPTSPVIAGMRAHIERELGIAEPPPEPTTP